MLACLLVVNCALAHDHGHDHGLSRHDEGGRSSYAGTSEIGSDEIAVEVTAAMKGLVRQLLDHSEKHPPSTSKMVEAGVETVNVNAAIRRLESKLPSDVASLVRVTADDKSQQPFAEESLAKARKYLNELVFKAWG